MNRIAQSLKEKRAEKKLTQQELADLLHVSRSTISNWETSRNYPDLDTLIKISDLLDISLDIMLKEETGMVNEIMEEVKNGTKRKWLLRLIVPLFLITLFISIYSVVQNVSSVHNYFFPMKTGIVKEVKKDEWHSISFEANDYLIFDNIFWDKEITNSANSKGDIILRIKDSKGKVVEGNLEIPQGKSIIFEKNKKNEKYFLEIKGQPGEYIVTIT
ncbi:helix-turn-helix domain-containing protein [Peribacillus sp. NPDC097295]|uniref:helix-turn-helix domain-containing protein n=1 Tax=Peribacillus sp. NPDC097295 TaxID=3364402 RepID=UPI003829FDE1